MAAFYATVTLLRKHTHVKTCRLYKTSRIRNSAYHSLAETKTCGQCATTKLPSSACKPLRIACVQHIPTFQCSCSNDVQEL
jgi:hypothetical protein